VRQRNDRPALPDEADSEDTEELEASWQPVVTALQALLSAPPDGPSLASTSTESPTSRLLLPLRRWRARVGLVPRMPGRRGGAASAERSRTTA